jgi:hypothetical protein
MNRIAAIALFAGTILITAGSAAAQSKVVEVVVPFNFTVNNTLLPAGNYTVGFDLLYSDVLVIRDGANNITAKGLGQHASIGEGKPRTLIFHHYGSQYFLSGARFDSDSSGIFLPATKSEQRARRLNRNEELAFISAH